MAGVYIHIPFCKKACHYCNFHFSTTLKYKNELLKALLNEIRLRSDVLLHQQIDTIYFGGGTPGILTIPELAALLGAVRQHYLCDNLQEVTIEMNPDDVSDEKITQLKDLGFTRVSLGVQSFFDEDLQYMNRSHDSAKAAESIERIHQHFTNYTVDLIYGYPMLDDTKLALNVNRLITIGTPHVSIYGMTLEPQTALDSFIKKGKEKPMNPEQGARQFNYLMQQLPAAGYEHYEISSYAKKGFRAIHNSQYWSGEPYLGFGPGAHSYFHNQRSWNIANNAAYTKAMHQGLPYQQFETLSEVDLLNEMVMLRLRVSEGLSLAAYKSKSTPFQYATLLKKANSLEREGLVTLTYEHLLLTRQGKLFCDAITADLFI